MSFTLPELPYAPNALEPTISKETIEYHYGKHHQAYVTNLNKLIEGTEYANSTLESIIAQSTGGVFNNAAQVWNHSFYWNCLTPTPTEPTGSLLEAINATFGSLDAFKVQFSTAAATNFGSGWTWLIKKSDESLEIVSTSNADTPIKNGAQVLLTIDVWEHAYYVDYRNARPKYIEEFWKLVNWDFVAKNFK
ncbi:MAG: superoxide dismutase [Fe] [Fibrobacterales bacterium]